MPVRRRNGGVSSAIHEVAAGGRRYILRLVPVRPEVPGHDPVAEVRTEALALDALRHLSLAPDLVAADPEGLRCGVAASLQTCLPGEVAVARVDIDGLAGAVRRVHEHGADPSSLSSFDPWLPAGSMVDLPTGGALGLVHRDFHPGNVLFRDGVLTGIVDWVHARRGPVEVDVSRCRVEVALLAGMDAADAFLKRCRPLVPDYDRRWDALVAAELAPWAHDLLVFNRLGASLTVTGIRRTLDDLTRAATR